MTQEEIVEGNKLIAEFIGHKIVYIDGVKPAIEWQGGHVESIDHYARYHNDWNWLWLVIKKVNNTAINNYGEMGVYIHPNVCLIGENETDASIMTTKGNHPDSREMIWQAIVTFIKWYNSIDEAQLKEVKE